MTKFVFFFLAKNDFFSRACVSVCMGVRIVTKCYVCKIERKKELLREKRFRYTLDTNRYREQNFS